MLSNYEGGDGAVWAIMAEAAWSPAKIRQAMVLIYRMADHWLHAPRLAACRED